MKRPRVMAIVVVAGGFAAASLMLGLITNVASSQREWPGWLRLLQTHPWQSFGVLALVAVALAAVLAVLSDPGSTAGVGASPTAKRGTSLVPEPGVPAAVTVSRGLPRDTAAFVDREELLRRLTEAVGVHDGRGVLPVHVVDGMPGVGKTTFAVHVGHLLAERFPDGQLFVNLNGYTSGKRPVSPSDALASLLTADGLPAQRIPIGADGWAVTEARAAMWRSRLAGRRMLVILDNAASFAQVEPLLPGSGDCLVVVTSRRRLAELEGVTVAMDALSPADAADLLTRLSGRDPQTLDAAAVAELATLGGFLPLAISLLAAWLRHHPLWSVQRLAQRVRVAQDRLGALRAGDRAVAAAFDLSYQDLPDARQRFFRRLGWFPGVTFDAYSAAALAGVPVEAAGEQLDALYDDHLLDENGDGRYQMHDLVRDYSRTLAAGDGPAQRRAGLDRLTGFYLTAITAANQLIARPGSPLPTTTTVPAGEPGSRSEPSIPHLGTRDAAVGWVEDERATILALVDEATGGNQPVTVIRLAAAMGPFLRQAGPWDQALGLHRAAANAAEDIRDRGAQAEALAEAGVVLRLMADYPGAVADLTRAIDLFAEVGHGRGQGHALNQLGIVHYLTGAYQLAVEAQEEALARCRELADELGQANALADLGMVRRQTSRFAEAQTAQSAALALYQRLGDCYGEANVLRDLGIVHTVRGDYRLAVERHTAALEIYQRLGDRAHQGYALNELGLVRRILGDWEAAGAAHVRALDLYVELGDRFGQANSIRHLGVLRRLAGEAAAAVDAQTEALGLYQAVGSQGGQASCLVELGVLRGQGDDLDAARDAFEKALSLLEDLGDRWGEAQLRNHWGELLLQHRIPTALAQFTAALEIARDIQCPLEEARALAGIGLGALGQGDRDPALAALRRSSSIFEQLGVPQPAAVAECLAANNEDDQ